MVYELTKKGTQMTHGISVLKIIYEETLYSLRPPPETGVLLLLKIFLLHTRLSTHETRH